MASGVTNPKEALVTEVRSESDRIQLRLKELQNLIDQSQAEVKRMQQRSIDATTQLNRLEANFDTVPRNDIKVIYTNALDSKTRLLTMQNQLEKVQQDRTQLDGFSKTLERLLLLLEGVPAGSLSSMPVMAVGRAKSSNGNLSKETIIRIGEAQGARRQ